MAQKMVAEPCPATAETRFHCADRAGRGRGDFLVAEAFYVRKNDHPALLLGERTYAFSDHVAEFSSQGMILRRFFTVCERHYGRPLFIGSEGIERACGMSLVNAHLIVAGVGYDAE